jgi:hypothetical protein
MACVDTEKVVEGDTAMAGDGFVSALGNGVDYTVFESIRGCI